MNANMSIAVQTIKDNISAVDIGRVLGLEIRHGRCKCPIHGGNDYNCVLYKGNRGFYCHVCKEGGDIVSFVRKYYNMSFKDAVSWINATFHMGLDLEGKIDRETQRRAEMAQRMRKNAIEFQEWKDRMRLDLALAVDLIVEKLEERRDLHAPKTPDEAWDPLFCEAIRVLPAARKFAEKCFAECLKKNET